jgi:hydrogenase nickel incorporation protein HypB
MNKIDLLPHVPFDVGRAIDNALQVNPELTFFQTSALTGRGLGEWFDFLRQQAPVPAGA